MPLLPFFINCFVHGRHTLPLKLCGECNLCRPRCAISQLESLAHFLLRDLQSFPFLLTLLHIFGSITNEVSQVLYSEQLWHLNIVSSLSVSSAGNECLTMCNPLECWIWGALLIPLFHTLLRMNPHFGSLHMLMPRHIAGCNFFLLVFKLRHLKCAKDVSNSMIPSRNQPLGKHSKEVEV